MDTPLLAKLSATTLFLQEWVNDPRQIGAIAPSSKNLAAAMARWLPPEPNSYVLELGPGTGAVTQALLQRGHAPDRLVAIEKSPKMAEHLRERFPDTHIVTGDALDLVELLKLQVNQSNNIAVVFSSLPMMNFEPEAAARLAQSIRAVLRPKGRLVQYSYHIGTRQPKAPAHFRFVDAEWVLLNLPPARVSVYEK
jgi:phosphatidylethanolamine/phosphatidyl-N-methylethanolamine N-methyltransferase